MSQPQISRIALPTPWSVGPANCYLIRGDTPTLVDLGPLAPHAFESLEHGLADLGCHPRDIAQVVITHAHIDHFGIANRFLQVSGAKLLTHEANESCFNDYDGDWQRRSSFYVDLYRLAGAPAQAIEGVEERYAQATQWAEGAEVSRLLREGDSVRMGSHDWQVLHTPGHSYGHICLQQRESRVLLVGDTLLRHITSNPIAEPPQGEGAERPRSLVQYLESLRRLERLNIDIMYAGHGEPITNHRGLIRERLQFHRARKERVYKCVRRGVDVIYDVAVEMFPGLSAVEMPLALFEVIGHLDLLEAESRVYYLPEDGVARICLR